MDKEFKKDKLNLECKLTDQELQEKGKKLAYATSESTRLKANLKTIQTDYKAKITEQEAKIESLSLVISRGTEFRDVECMINYNKPVPGQKTIIRTDTNEIHYVEIMTTWEKENLFIKSNREKNEESEKKEDGEVPEEQETVEAAEAV